MFGQVVSYLIRGPESSSDRSEFKMVYGNETRNGSLKKLISDTPLWTHLFPDTPKDVALGSER